MNIFVNKKCPTSEKPGTKINNQEIDSIVINWLENLLKNIKKINYPYFIWIKGEIINQELHIEFEKGLAILDLNFKKIKEVNFDEFRGNKNSAEDIKKIVKTLEGLHE
ncbi:hypothetical protein K8R66_04350 [bacterium]|nr:hypothetical protein [bacterium]